MIDIEAFNKVSYGMYIVSSGKGNEGNGFISNSVIQVTSEPPQFAVCCHKNNYSSEMIEKHRSFVISVLKQDTKPEIIGRFGFRNGKMFNKLEGMEISYDESGTPIVMNESIAYIECTLKQRFDVGSHFLFIGEAINTHVIENESEPLTYAYYKKVKKGFAPKNAPTYLQKKAVP
ncbi:MAG: flavin reductase [Bacteroidales bacterium]|nr:flavin reductase [Bacteroidales bacterium]